MLNPTVRFVPFTVNGKTYQLALDFNAIAECEQKAGANLFLALGLSGNTMAQNRGILWAALLKAQPKTTLQEAGDLLQEITLQPDGIPYLFTSINQCLENSMPDPNPTAPETTS